MKPETKPNKKRRPRPKKPKKNNTPETLSAPVTPPASIEHDNYKSPRKEAIMRYKQSNDERPHNLRNTLKSKPIDQEHLHINLEEKVTLFKYSSAKILELNSSTSTGSLLAHGEFEIFQLHKGDVTYLSCGSQFIYPLLPKIKIFRINSNQFLLPLVNPERYWKIFIKSEEDNVLKNLQFTLERKVQYITLQDSESTIFEIPESPPSAPISPFEKTPFEKSSFSPFQASPIKQEIPSLRHPKPKFTKYVDIDEKTDSSMDSLLEEFEDNISKHTFSRPVSRVPSIHSRQFHDGRSRRSSRSELYTSESGWMEPNIQHPPHPFINRIPKSRSNYSINSSNDLSSIYKSVIRNEQKPNRLPTIPANKQSDFTKNDLNSSEIYQLLSSKPKPKRSPSFTSRLFGW